MMTPDDFRTMSFYQIWIRSFKDGNGDGIGDLKGVLEKLDYIKSLGVDAIWFSPIYPSPNADYGYDISDYKNIHPDYGTLEDFREVLDRAHALGLKVLLDLVINHTSDEHPWFRASAASREGPYSDYYIWRDPRYVRGRRRPPNNWFSQFEGRAWEYCPARDQYYLHVFARKQPDLNMDNPRVREEVRDIMKFWLDMGVDGFREDVINYISKTDPMPDGIPFLPAINGLPYYKDGPHLLEYLKEFREVALRYGALQIGEAPMTDVETALTYVSGKDRVLDMLIQFDTMNADCFLTEYVWHPFSLRKYKRACSKWQNALQGKAWNALYLENHDHPRIISRYGSQAHWRASGTCLAASYLFQQGCPFLYQGQEIGMTNIRLPSIEEYLDVASINAYHRFHKREPQEIRMRRIHVSSRDSARTPVQWDRTRNAGFTSATPWFRVNPNYRKINAASEEKDPMSILNFYRRCLALRKSSPVLLYGGYREHQKRSRTLYMYERFLKGDRYLIVCSFAGFRTDFVLPASFRDRPMEKVLSNYEEEAGPFTLLPYEARVYRTRPV